MKKKFVSVCTRHFSTAFKGTSCENGICHSRFSLGQRAQGARGRRKIKTKWGRRSIRTAKGIPGENHLPKTCTSTKDRKVRDRDGREQVEEDDGEDGIAKAEVEDTNTERAEGKGRDGHVGRHPHRETINGPLRRLFRPERCSSDTMLDNMIE